MSTIFCDPLFYILIVNIIALIWAVRSWKKSVRERWMNSLRDAGAELIGAAELIYGMNASDNDKLVAAKSSFIAKEQKLLLLFAHNDEEKKSFYGKSEKLRSATEKRNTEEYRAELNNFSNDVSARVLKEWKVIK